MVGAIGVRSATSSPRTATTHGPSSVRIRPTKVAPARSAGSSWLRGVLRVLEVESIRPSSLRLPSGRERRRTAEQRVMTTLSVPGGTMAGMAVDSTLALSSEDALRRTIAALAGPDASPARTSCGAVDELVDDRRAGAGRAGHRLGQVGGLLGGDRGAARRRRRSDPGGVAAARPDARPDRRGGAGRAAGGHGQLDQRRRVGRRCSPTSRDGQHRRAAGLAGAAGQPAVRPPAARAARRAAGCWSSTRRTASRTGASTSGPTTSGSPARCSSLAAGHAGAGHHRHRQRAGHRRRRRPARRRHRRRSAARWPGPRCAWPSCRGSTPLERYAWVADALRRAARLGHRLRAHRRRDRAARRLPAEHAGTTSRPTRRQTENARSSSRTGCAATRSRRSSPRRRSAWATTSPIWRSASTSGRRRRRSPTTSRSAGPAARSTTRSPCCCRPRPTSGSGSTSPPPASPTRRQVERILDALADGAAVAAGARERRPASAAAGSRRCSRSWPSTTR